MDYSFYDLFLTTSVPEALTFRTFSFAHIMYLVVSFFIVFFLAKYGAKNKAKCEKLIKILSAFLFFLYFYRFYMFYKYDYKYDLMDNLPFHLCIINQFVIPYAVYAKKQVLLNASYAIGIPAAVMAMFTPSMLYKEYFYLSWFVIFFFVVHILIVLIPVLGISIGMFRPDAKLLPKVCGVFFGYTGVIFIVNKLMHTNYMFINIPEAGTLMEPLYIWLGNPGFMLPLLFVVLFVIFAMYLPWLVIDKKRYADFAA